MHDHSRGVRSDRATDIAIMITHEVIDSMYESDRPWHFQDVADVTDIRDAVYDIADRFRDALTQWAADERHPDQRWLAVAARTGHLLRNRPTTVSPAIHAFVRALQHRAPTSVDTPHGARWRAALPQLAGTAADGRDDERVTLIHEWMWSHLATHDGSPPPWVPAELRDLWAVMLRDRTPQAARAVHEAASTWVSWLGYYVAEAVSTTGVKAAAAAAAVARVLAEHACPAWGWERTDPAGLLHRLAVGHASAQEPPIGVGPREPRRR